MTSGPYAGITVFQDRSSTTGATMSGSGNMSNTGTFYFPDATLTLSGTAALTPLAHRSSPKTSHSPDQPEFK